MRGHARDAQHIRQIIDTLTHTGLVADSNSESSERIRRIQSSQLQILTETARRQLSKVVIFGIDIPVCDAFPNVSNHVQKIILFDGLLYLIRFYADLQTIIALLIEQASHLTIEVADEPMPIALAMSLAGYTALAESIDSGHQLMDISAVLGPRAQQRVAYGFGAATLFFLLHELGHLVCGHMDRGYVSERVTIETRVREAINPNHQMEFEADAFALGCIHPQVRNPIISSIMFAFGPFAFLETFRGSADAGHPLTVNRVAALADSIHFPDDPESAEATRNIIDSEVHRFERLAASRESTDGDIRYKIKENMPLPLAYQTMNQVGEYIKSHFGVLEDSD